MPKTREELGEDLCNFCEHKGLYCITQNGPVGCEGQYCEQAYEEYLNTIEEDEE